MSGVQVRGNIKANADGKFDDRLAATIGERLIALEKANRGASGAFVSPSVPAFGAGSPGPAGPAGAPGAPGAPGATDHGALTGLEDDDHPQYVHREQGAAPHVHTDAHLIDPSINVQLEDALVVRRGTLDFQNSRSVNWRVEDDMPALGAAMYWNFNETSGSRRDSAGSYHLTEFGGSIGVAAGIVGNAAQLDGAHSFYVNSFPLPQPPANFTITAWVWLDSKPAHIMGIVSKWSAFGNNRQFILCWENTLDRFIFAVSSDGTGAGVGEVDGTTFPAPTLGAWHFVAAYHDSVNDLLGISVDGGPVQTQPWTTGVFAAGTDPFNVAVFTPGEEWHGRMDEVRFFNSALTLAQIRSIYMPAPTGRVLLSADVPAGSVIPAPHQHTAEELGFDSRFYRRGERVPPQAHQHLMADVADLRPDDAQFVLASRVFGG